MGTLGKALGAFGAYVAGSRRLVDLLVSKARTFVFTTALPPAACGAALAALDVLREEPVRRERLHALALRMKAGLARLGFDVSRVVAPIFPVVLGTEERALAASRALRERGFFVRAIRPPTVPARHEPAPRGAHRRRTPEAQVDAFLGALEEVVRELPASQARSSSGAPSAAACPARDRSGSRAGYPARLVNGLLAATCGYDAAALRSCDRGAASGVPILEELHALTWRVFAEGPGSDSKVTRYEAPRGTKLTFRPHSLPYPGPSS